MRRIKVNGVVCNCGDCINDNLQVTDEPCKSCWKAICMADDVSKVCFDDIAFYPKDKQHFLALEEMVRKYRDQFAAIKTDAMEHGVSIRELCKQFARHRSLSVWIDGIR